MALNIKTIRANCPRVLSSSKILRMPLEQPVSFHPNPGRPRREGSWAQYQRPSIVVCSQPFPWQAPSFHLANRSL